MRSIIAQDLRGFKGSYAATRCLPPGYLNIRFGVTSDTLTGMAAGLQSPAFVEVNVMYIYTFEKHTEVCSYRHIVYPTLRMLTPNDTTSRCL